MTTLHEEQIPISNRKHSLDFDRISEEDKYDDNNDESDRKNGFPDYEMPNQTRVFTTGNRPKRPMIPSSRTLDSLDELRAPNKSTSTPSTSSSGYGSEAVSSTNLSSEDSMSLRSMSIDETPVLESRPMLTSDLKPVTENVDSDCSLADSQGRATDGADVGETAQQISDNVPSDNTVTNLPPDIHDATNKNEEKTGYDSPTEGTSIVKTKLQPGKVRNH